MHMNDVLHLFQVLLDAYLHNIVSMFKVVQYLIVCCFVMHRKEVLNSGAEDSDICQSPPRDATGGLIL
jgi:hypothetical protein